MAEIIKGIKRNYTNDQKPSPTPSLPRRGDNMAVPESHVDTEHKGSDNANGDLIRADSVDTDYTRSDSASSEEMEIARSLARDFIYYKTSTNPLKTAPSIHAETLRRVGDEMEERYEITLNGIVNQLKYNPNGNGRQAFNACLDSMFEKGSCNWGRVVMVYVFAARLAKYCQKKEKQRDGCIEDLVSYCGDFVSEQLSEWINTQGGWDDFCDKFRSRDWKDKAVFNSLLGTGLVLGGMAILRLLTK